MIKYFLDFRKLVHDSLEDSPTAGNDILRDLPKLKQEVMDHAYFVKMGIGPKYAVNRRLHQMQKDTITLLDLLFNNRLDGRDNEYCVLANSCLLEILKCLQESEYFDVGQRVPRFLIEEVAIGLKEKVTLIEAGMKKAKIDVKLQTLVLEPFLKFESKQSNYQRMDYLLNLASKLIIRVQGNACGEEDLLNLLVQRSFNTKSFHQYYTKKMLERTKVHYQISAQLDELYNLEREFHQLPKSQKHCYNPFSECCRSTFLKFVRIEIAYILKRQELNQPTKPAIVSQSAYRIKTSLSVDSLAYLLRLLVEADIIEAQPKTELMAFIAAHFHTRGKGEGNISAESLITKYRQVTQSTAVGMRSLLTNMTRQVQDNFGL
jgi:hypothetical protein